MGEKNMGTAGTDMLNRKSLRRRLRDGERLAGLWLIAPSPAFIEIARPFGLDLVTVDMEHGMADLGVLVDVMRILRGTSTAVLVRVPSHDPTLVSRVLDRGADGVIVPRVDDRDTAARMAAAARFPPAGNRGLAIGALRASDYGRSAEYRRDSDDAVVLVQIESGAALADATAIATAPGVDMAFIGPGDLGADMRLEGDDQRHELRSRIDDCLARLKAAGVPVGTVPHCGRAPADLFEAGFSLVLHGSDVAIMQEGLQRYHDLSRPGAF